MPTPTFGAILLTQAPTHTPPPPTATLAPTQQPTDNPVPWTDELLTMYGICFEAALDASGQVFVLRNAEEHIRFYDLADNSGLCRRPVERAPFDFQSGERLLAGLWSAGTGCTAQHEVQAFNLEDDVLTLDVQFTTAGACNYELVRPFWVGVEGVQDVQINITGAGENENPPP